MVVKAIIEATLAVDEVARTSREKPTGIMQDLEVAIVCRVLVIVIHLQIGIMRGVKVVETKSNSILVVQITTSIRKTTLTPV